MGKALLGVLLVLATFSSTDELNDQTFAKWKDYILPKAEELSWQTIPWRSVLWNAVIEAQQQEKPILMWAMNGHPLACT